jgi:protein-tyrosine phosphatase
MGENIGMIDLHNHILSGLDDGAKSIEESIEMCWISYRDGVRSIVATPHTFNGEYQNDRSTILSKVHELNEAIKKLGMRNAECGVDDVQSEICNLKSGIFLHSALRTPNSELKILPGADVHFCEEILPQLDQGKVTTISDGGKFLIIEFPFHVFPYRAEELLFQLMARGITPIISHPERNLEIGQRPRRYYQMIRMGCLGQVTAMSLTGGFGPWIRRAAEKLLTHRLLHFIASDAHSIDERPPVLSAAVRVAEKILGGEEAWKMVNEYPQAVIEGRRPDVPEPIRL